MIADVGLDGRNAAAVKDGLPWATWMGLTARLRTRYGRQLMRPDYGLDMTDQVGRNVSNLDFVDLRRRVKRAIAPLKPSVVAVQQAPDDRIDIRIRL